jgi:hypothetical protein
MAMYLILTTKPGQYRTELAAGLNPVEAYDYVFCGAVRARFVIAEAGTAERINVIDEGTPPVVNKVPVKFFPSFNTLADAQAELRHLVTFGHMQVSLDPVPLPRLAAA